MKRFFIFLIILSNLCSNVANAQKKIVGHKAVYDLSLYSASRGSSVINAKGKMVYELKNKKNNWEVNNSIELNLTLKSGELKTTYWKLNFLEQKDGKKFIFNVQSFEDDKIVAKVRGKAIFKDKNKGFVTFEEPSFLKKRINKKIDFPIEHTKKIIQAFENNQKIVSQEIFDGTSMEAFYFANAVISKAKKPTKNNFIKSKYIDVNIAFFANDKKEMPEYSVSAQYHKNGISENITHDFGDFKIFGKLENLKIYED